jgi:signal transduction histidine kinase
MQSEAFRNARILVVDDQEINVLLLEDILQSAGFRNVLSTTDSREVLNQFAKYQPDLILLDLMMPHLDGFEIIALLRPLISEESYLPILVLTADITKEVKRRALSVGAADYITKPFDHVEVLLRINNLLKTRFLHQESQRYNRLLEEKVQARTEELTRMLQQVQVAQETERRRLSMELHDGPLQSLGVCTMATDRAIRRFERGEPELAFDGLRELRNNLTGTIAEVRGVLADLSSEILNNYGLTPALRDYIERFTDATGVAVSFNMRLDDLTSENLPPQVAFLMYRLTQEALSNVRKHADANKVEVSLEIYEGELYMSIADDGIGFDADASPKEHRMGEQLGIPSMRERIRQAHGELWIVSGAGRGTSLKFRCPLGATV